MLAGQIIAADAAGTADNDLGLLILADGMGGYKAGDVASSIATGLAMDYLKAQIEQLSAPRGMDSSGGNIDRQSFGRIIGDAG